MTERHISFTPPPGVKFHGLGDNGQVYVTIEVLTGATWVERMDTRGKACDTANRLREAVEFSCDEELDIELSEQEAIEWRLMND